jgi:excisionase family DNA binding protein
MLQTFTTTRLLTIPMFARNTGLTPRLARELVRNGDIPSLQVGCRRRIDERWVNEWLNSSSKQQVAKRAS